METVFVRFEVRTEILLLLPERKGDKYWENTPTRIPPEIKSVLQLK